MRRLPATFEHINILRSAAWGRASCWYGDTPVEHDWIYLFDPADQEMTVMVICGDCGRTPVESLAELPIRLPQQ